MGNMDKILDYSITNVICDIDVNHERDIFWK